MSDHSETRAAPYAAPGAPGAAPAPDEGEAAYLALVAKILATGERRVTRNGPTLSVFGERLRFDLRRGFPLLTTKRIFARGVVEELLWFLRGETDAKKLAAKGVHIWDGNTTRAFLDARGLTGYAEGEAGPIYGFQWRAFGGAYPSRDGGADQLRYVLDELTRDPASRRAVLSAWNPQQLGQMALPPCHILYQFSLSERDGLSCQMVARSQDVMLGTPFNIASTALLTHLIAAALHVPAKEVVLVAGDAHIYEAHRAGAETQLVRAPAPELPRLVLKRPPPARDAPVEEKLNWLETLRYDDVEFAGYVCQPAIAMRMIA